MNNLEKLIENGGWLPIEEAPKDGFIPNCVFLRSDNIILGIASIVNGMISTSGAMDEYPYRIKDYPITHFMSLYQPERTAKAFGVLLSCVKTLRSHDKRWESVGAVDGFMDEAIAEAERIIMGTGF